MVLFTALAFVALLIQPIAAEDDHPQVYCCGELGSFDETKAWERREQFCRNPRAHTPTGESDEGYLLQETDLLVSSGLEAIRQGPAKAAAFYGQIKEGGEFNNCWYATEELIVRCARDNKALGSWIHGKEVYAMSLTGELHFNQPSKRPALHLDRKRRANFAKRSLDELSSVSSEADLYHLAQPGEIFDVDGEDIEINFVNTMESLPKHDMPGGHEEVDGLRRRSEGLATTDGYAYHWEESFHNEVNLADIIRRDLADMKAKEQAEAASGNTTLSKRLEWSSFYTCDERRLQGWSQYNTWTVVQAGNFLLDPVPSECVAADFLERGMKNDVIFLQKDQEVCESFSTDWSPDELKHLVREFAGSRNENWVECFTARDLKGIQGCVAKWKGNKGRSSRQEES